MSLIEKARRRLTGEMMPPVPFAASEQLATRVFSLYDEPHQPSARLLHLALEAAREAEHISLAALAARSEIARAKLPQRFTQWPGEHYRLLAALMRALQPKNVVEIGTFLGWSALAMRQELPAGGCISTFDITPWDALPETGLRREDFESGAMIQHVADLADPRVVAAHHDLLVSADMVFMDGPHDGATEVRMVNAFRQVQFRNDPLFIFDDIKMPALLKFWRDLPLPKLDITSFGHWSGTGLAEWKPFAADIVL